MLLSDGIRCKIVDIKKMKEAQNAGEEVLDDGPASNQISNLGAQVPDASAESAKPGNIIMIDMPGGTDPDQSEKDQDNDEAINISVKEKEGRELTIIQL